jgi:sec-independent protein translocase protein TatA
MNTLALIPGMSGVPEILLIVFVVLLLFGSKKLPELARSLGKILNEFKKGQTESAPEKKIEKPAEPADEDDKKNT